MDRPKREALAAQLHAALVEQMTLTSRTLFLLTGRPVDPIRMVEQMEADLRTQTERIGRISSVYSAAELKIRAAIAQRVVADIRRAVQSQE